MAAVAAALVSLSEILVLTMHRKRPPVRDGITLTNVTTFLEVSTFRRELRRRGRDILPSSRRPAAIIKTLRNLPRLMAAVTSRKYELRLRPVTLDFLAIQPSRLVDRVRTVLPRSALSFNSVNLC